MQPSTGLPNLDNVFQGIRAGDNIVWQVDHHEDYFPLVKAFSEKALGRKEPVTYFRFGKERELVSRESGARVYDLNPEAGFEAFITRVHQVIEQSGEGGNYVFDSLSELTIDCFSERMVGNFFTLTCPLLFRMEAVAYFLVLRHHHSYHAALPIAETTQLLVDVVRQKETSYIHPLKVAGRYSPTLFKLHRWEKEDFTPVEESALISDVVTFAPWYGLQSSSYRMVGLWDRRFIQAEEILLSFENGECSRGTVDKVCRHQIEQLITRDDRILPMAEKYLDLSDVLHIWKRTIGSGLIGGKSVGMLLARAVLKEADPTWAERLEVHDSFYIGTDVFYLFLVQNECWRIRQNQKNTETLLDGAEEARELILKGQFPEHIIARFSDMLDYFGQSPIIVRSSSLLEDSFGNSFVGKYESVFCANQGTREQRLEVFLDAVRVVYASSMSEEALTYRAKRGVLEQDEQMALLVQRVSGAPYGENYYPQLAGVGLSYNPYVWHESIDPEAGLLRLVFGLGTKAVERSEDDYTRVVALNAPKKRPEGSLEEAKQHAQRRVDVLNLSKNRFQSLHFIDLVNESPGLKPEMFATCDSQSYASRQKGALQPWVLTFDGVFDKTNFIADMREMMKTLRETYGCQVDVEFTANLLSDGSFRINLVQCRPLKIQEGPCVAVSLPPIKKDQVILEAHSGIIGQSRKMAIDHVIFVVPEVYGHLPEQDRYSVARLIGDLTHHDEIKGEGKTLMLIGPGRWGTTMPSLGVPVSFTQINTVSVLCEIDAMHEGLVPDLSLGTHFFNEMVERDILYVGYFRARKENAVNTNFLENSPNLLPKLLPESAAWSKVVRVIASPEGKGIYLDAKIMKQTAILYQG